jgi:hypothetical protein
MIIAAVVGLVLGVGGGTVFAMATRPDAPPPAALSAADSLASDSAHAAVDPAGQPAPADSATVPADHAALDPAPDATPVGAQPIVRDSLQRQAIAPPTVPTPATRPKPVDSTSVRLGRIFGAMKPEDAAAVLSQLDDVDVKVVLFQLTDRKAADILARFPDERAATLTRTMLTDARAH